MKILIIAEKPNVAREIANYLGMNATKNKEYHENDDWIVTSASGHLVEFELPPFSVKELPLFPEFKLKPIDTPNATRYLGIIRKLLARKDISSVWNACDAGMEGTAIFGRIYKYLNCTLPVKRLWVQDTTSSGYKKAFANVYDGNDDLVYAASECRAKADGLIGVNFSRATHIETGRVMTPTATFVVNAFLNNKNHKPEDYWEIDGTFVSAGNEFSCRLYDDKEEKIKKFKTLAEVESILQSLPYGTKCDLIEEQVSAPRKAPTLFNGNDLQKEMSKRYGYSVDKVLEIGQSVHDKHKAITYVRTEQNHFNVSYVESFKSVHFASLVNLGELGKFAQFVLDNDLIQPTKKNVFDNTKTGEHHGIIPTGVILINGVERPLKDVSVEEIKESMSIEEWNLFDLVVRQFISSMMPDAEFSKTTRKVITNEGHLFKTTGSILVKEGWLALWGKEASSDTTEILTPVDKNDVILGSASSVNLKTKAPPLLTEATLITKMERAGKEIDDEELAKNLEEKGIGTVATRAPTIAKLKGINRSNGTIDLSKAFIQLQKNKTLIPTEKMLNKFHFYNKHCPILLDPLMTAQWERSLDEISKGKLSPEKFMSDIKDFITEKVNEVRANISQSLPKVKDCGCPACGSEIAESKFRWECINSSCNFSVPKNFSGGVISERVLRELLKNGKTTETLNFVGSKTGKKFNAFITLSKQEDGSYKCGFEFPAPVKYELPCPACKGDLKETKMTLSCQNEKCGFTLWKKVGGKDGKLLSDKDVQLLLLGKKTSLIRMVSKAGKPFETHLVLKKDLSGNVEFVFPEGKGKSKSK